MKRAITYIVPHRNVDEYREKNLNVVLDWIRLLKYDKEIIVVEQDDKPKLNLPEDVNHIFIKNAGMFTKAWAMNVGIKAATNELIVMCDSDCFFSVEDMNLFLEEMIKGNYKVGSPNHYNFTRLKKEETEKVHKNILTFNEPRKDKALGAGLTGGCFAATKEALFHIKLWDEDFVGWGGEDSAMGSKFTKAGWTIASKDALRLELLGYHLWHPSKLEQKGYMDNKKVNSDLWKKRYTKLALSQYLQYLNTVDISSLGDKNKYDNG